MRTNQLCEKYNVRRLDVIGSVARGSDETDSAFCTRGPTYLNADVFAPLEDILRAASAIQKFVGDASFEEFSGKKMLFSAVERKFEIIAEAIVRIRRLDAQILEPVRGHRQIVAFRNILAHGYDTIDEKIVWSII